MVNGSITATAPTLSLEIRVEGTSKQVVAVKQGMGESMKYRSWT